MFRGVLGGCDVLRTGRCYSTEGSFFDELLDVPLRRQWVERKQVFLNRCKSNENLSRHCLGIVLPPAKQCLFVSLFLSCLVFSPCLCSLFHAVSACLFFYLCFFLIFSVSLPSFLSPSLFSRPIYLLNFFWTICFILVLFYFFFLPPSCLLLSFLVCFLFTACLLSL